jgi:mannitol/fructose-specific phosphotransferase system IIA component (Ntr-type)
VSEVPDVKLSEKLTPELVLIAPSAEDRGQLLSLFGTAFADAGMVDDGRRVVERLEEREAILSTGIGGGVAVPHAQVPGLGRLAMAASTHPNGIDYPTLDDQPVRLAFCLIGDSTTAADHLAGLARLARLARRVDVLEELINAENGEQFLAVLARIEGE